MSANRTWNNVHENVEHITYPPNRQQQAQNTWEEGRPEKKVTEYDAMKAEEHQGDVKADCAEPDEHQRERLQLIRLERA